MYIMKYKRCNVIRGGWLIFQCRIPETLYGIPKICHFPRWLLERATLVWLIYLLKNIFCLLWLYSISIDQYFYISQIPVKKWPVFYQVKFPYEVYIYITGASSKQSKSEIERKINYYSKSAMWIRNRIITKNYWDCIYAG